MGRGEFNRSAPNTGTFLCSDHHMRAARGRPLLLRERKSTGRRALVYPAIPPRFSSVGGLTAGAGGPMTAIGLPIPAHAATIQRRYAKRKLQDADHRISG